MVARELTKVHQEVFRGRASDLVEQVGGKQRGEFTVVIGPSTNIFDNGLPSSDADIVAMFGQLANDGVGSRRELVSRTAKRLGISSKAVYAAIERAKDR
jgi:16S rRNA C1402 (ribose-2'-O) methylase RsmI